MPDGVRLALCLEQTLGHRTHSQNLEQALAARGATATVLPVEYPGHLARLPWAMRASGAALAAVRRRAAADDVLFFHTQSLALFAPLAAGRRPYVVSVDATPLQMDRYGQWYAHRTHGGRVEAAKRAMYRRVFGQARALVAWSEWAAGSLVRDYGVPRGRITVAHPGAPASLFALERTARDPAQPPRILFVGGDFARKGGPLLLDAFAPLAGRAELVLVTEAELAPRPGVRILHGVRPGTDRFLAAFREADLFCLPTLGDCTPVAIGEALAAGLPVITTAVGSNEETVRSGETGIVVPPGDGRALAEAMRTLVDDHAARERMQRRAREDARARFDATANAGRVLDLLEAVA